MLLYSICYYYGKNKISNLINHFNSFLKINTKEKQFVFISMIIERCLSFSNKVIVIINDENYYNYNYNILYVINNLLSSFNSVNFKKLDKNNYVFCVTI